MRTKSQLAAEALSYAILAALCTLVAATFVERPLRSPTIHLTADEWMP